MRNAKYLALSTWLFVAIVLALIFLTGSSIPDGPKGADSGARPAAFALLIVALVPMFITGIRMRRFAWLPAIVGVTSATIAGFLWWLVESGRDAAAWSAYGGLQVLRAKENFNDLAWIVRSISCGGCASQNTNYGPGVAWIDTWTFHLVTPSLTPFLGFALIIALSLALAWLMRNSEALGWPVLAITAISSSWLLLLDRGNLDAFVFLLPVLAVILVRWRNSLAVWVAVAVLIWILGTWKYYPFALGVLLIPVLFIRRGWVVLSAFAFASAVFLFANLQSIKSSSQGNSDALVIFDFPATGRLPIVARLVKEFSPTSNPLLPNLLLILLALIAASWGWVVAQDLRSTNSHVGMLAAGGTSVFLASTFVTGFGFAYKNVFLLLAIPMLALAAKSKSAVTLYSGICILALILISLVTGYSILLASLSSLIAASFAFGASIRLISRKNSSDPVAEQLAVESLV